MNMKNTGIIRRIDDLGRVIIPKEIRRTLELRENNPMEIHVTQDGVYFKKINYTEIKEKLLNSTQNKEKIKMKKTLVMSAFPASGKTFAYNKYKNSKIIFDSDSSEFSWIKDEFGNNTKERNPDFPNNYIQHIKDNLGKADIIFISSHLNVRQAMKDNDIDYITVYPSKECRLEWVGRMHLRGNDDKFISFINDNWDNFMFDIKNEPHGTQLWTLEHNQYIENCLVDFFK